MASEYKILINGRNRSNKDSDKSPTSDEHLLYMSLGALLTVMVLVMGVLWASGIFDFSEKDATPKILVAVLTLIATLFGTTVSLIGIMIKRSLDDRNLILKNEAEERLKLDTAIKAVELFKSASGSSSPAESAGALFALSRLGQSDFALRLLEELWPKNIIETPSAMWIINSALQSNESSAPVLAATILKTNSHKLRNGNRGRWWPEDYRIKWPSGIPFSAGLRFLDARIESLISVEFSDWDEDTIYGDTVFLSKCFRNEQFPTIRKVAAAYLVKLLQTYNPQDEWEIEIEDETLDIEKLKVEIQETYGASFSAEIVSGEKLEEKLSVWVGKIPP